MVNYAVLGLGMMGEAICFDILENDPNSKVFGFEIDSKRRNIVEQRFDQHADRFFAFNFKLDMSILPENSDLVTKFRDYAIKVAFGAIDYRFNEFLSKVCILASVHFLDLGGNPNVVAKQKALDLKAREANITIIPDCGLAPGMADVLAASLMNQNFDKLDSCKIRVGGLPQNPETILNYQQVFSIRGLTNEYLEDAEVISDGLYKNVPSLTELEEVQFELHNFPPFEAFQTAGGTSSLPSLFERKITTLDYKTIRYKGHWQFIKFLKDFELLSSEPYKDTKLSVREVVEHYLQKNLPKNNPDYVFVKIEVIGSTGGIKQREIMEIVDKFDEESNFSSMARTTAFPIAIIGQMIANGSLTSRGVVPGEISVPYKIFIEELRKRNIIIKTKKFDL